jgi:soluble lytic murein transglycosylase-like protein
LRITFVFIILFTYLLSDSNNALAQVYTYTDDNGIKVLTSRKPDTSRYQVKNHGCFGTCRTGVNWTITPLKQKLYSNEVNAAATAFGVDKALVRAIIHAESWFEPTALSSAGAQGLMQLMPATQERFGVNDPHDPQQNISAGVQYLAWLMKEFDQDVERVIAAYNAGENAVRRYNGVPPFNETREYLRRVNILYQRYASAI